MIEAEPYGVSAAAYLVRARSRLLAATKADLFYAALELRCCVEARQGEYLEHLQPYKDKKLRPFRLGESRAKIAAITGGRLIAKLTFTISERPDFTAFHTPVSAGLVRFCERQVDNLRHAQSAFRPDDDPWWHETRSALVLHYRLAWVACQGSLMVPPLWSASSRETHPLIFDIRDDNHLQVKALQSTIGSSFRVRVEYLETAPSDWMCDL